MELHSFRRIKIVSRVYKFFRNGCHIIFFLLIWAFSPFISDGQIHQKIDRKALVTRHDIITRDKNLKSPAQVGNGEFAFGFDFTGLQTFGENTNTLSDWGWHEFPLPKGEKPSDFKGQEWNTQGRMVRYDIQSPDQKALTDWMIENPQRINLGRIGLIFQKKDGTIAKIADYQDPVQKIDLWSGIATSTFEVDGTPVTVTTIGHPALDAIAVKITSPGISHGNIKISIAFPYASHTEFGSGADWDHPDSHKTTLTLGQHTASFIRTLDQTRFGVRLSWEGNATLVNPEKHHYELVPSGKQNEFSFVMAFDKAPAQAPLPTFDRTRSASITKWKNFWNSGGAIDLSASKDPRWFELERRIVLSQYVMAINEAGSLPPQESGLVNNGWHGKFHFEMIWWHEAHYALWNRWDIMNKALGIYHDDLEVYRKKAKDQGYDGVRWPKTLGGHRHWEWPNEINPLLIWQEPHPIFFAELDYRAHPSKQTLNKWKDVVLGTADFMASYPYYNQKEDRYILGYPLQVVSENANPRNTINPTFELSYWRTGLRIAQEWRHRLGLPSNPKYDEVSTKLSKLPVKDGLYVSWENIDSMWTKFNFEHPALIGAYGMLPGDGVDIPTMNKTLHKVEETWRFDRTWGWDYPMLAMCAARLGHGDQAIDFLLNHKGFDIDEHGLVGGGGPFPYFPGNGGLLYAVAMMAAGWDGAPPQVNAPGFPTDRRWVVKWEGLQKAL